MLWSALKAPVPGALHPFACLGNPRHAPLPPAPLRCSTTSRLKEPCWAVMALMTRPPPQKNLRVTRGMCSVGIWPRTNKPLTKPACMSFRVLIASQSHVAMVRSLVSGTFHSSHPSGGCDGGAASVTVIQTGRFPCDCKLPPPPPPWGGDRSLGPQSIENTRRQRRQRKSPRREVVRSSAGAGVIYPPFLGSFA